MPMSHLAHTRQMEKHKSSKIIRTENEVMSMGLASLRERLNYDADSFNEPRNEAFITYGNTSRKMMQSQVYKPSPENLDVDSITAAKVGQIKATPKRRGKVSGKIKKNTVYDMTSTHNEQSQSQNESVIGAIGRSF